MKLTEIVKKNFKKTALIVGVMLGSLGLNAQTMTQADFGVIRGSDAIDSAKVTISMVDDSTITQTQYTDGGYAHFDNVDLGPTSITPQAQNYKPLADVIGSGRDHTFNFESKNQPSNATIYDITGRAIAQLNPKWDGNDIASAYWDGTLSNGSQAPNGVYIFSNGKDFSKQFVQINEGESIGYQGISTNFEQKVKNRNQEIMNKSIKTISKLYAVLIEPASTSPLEQFQTFRDTVLMQEDPGQNQFGEYANPVPQNQDITVKLIDGYSHANLSGFIVRYKFPSDLSTIVQTTLTDANGNATFQDVPADSTMYLEYGGDTSYFASKGNLWKMPNKIIWQEDTTASDTILLELYTKQLPLNTRPGDPNYGTTVTVTAAQIKEMIGNTYINTEEDMGRKIRINLDPSWTAQQKQDFEDVLEQTDSLFYGSNLGPFEIVPTPIDFNFIDNNYQ